MVQEEVTHVTNSHPLLVGGTTPALAPTWCVENKGAWFSYFLMLVHPYGAAPIFCCKRWWCCSNTILIGDFTTGLGSIEASWIVGSNYPKNQALGIRNNDIYVCLCVCSCVSPRECVSVFVLSCACVCLNYSKCLCKYNEHLQFKECSQRKTRNEIIIAQHISTLSKPEKKD